MIQGYSWTLIPLTKDQRENCNEESKMIWSKTNNYFACFQRCQQFWVHVQGQPTANVIKKLLICRVTPPYRPVSDLCSPWHFSVGKRRRFFLAMQISRLSSRFEGLNPWDAFEKNRETLETHRICVFCFFMGDRFILPPTPKNSGKTTFFGGVKTKNVLVLHVKFMVSLFGFESLVPNNPGFACQKDRFCSTNWWIFRSLQERGSPFDIASVASCKPGWTPGWNFWAYD